MSMQVARQAVPLTVALDTATTTSKPFRFSEFSGGMVTIPTGSPITQLVYNVSSDGVTYTPLYDANGTVVSQLTLTAGRTYEMPSAVFAAQWVIITVNSAGSVIVQLKG